MARQTYATILLLAEGTDEGMKAARDAINLAADEDATLIIATVVDTTVLRQLLASRIFVQEEMEEYERDLDASCRKQINYVAQLAKKLKVKHETVLLKGACHASIIQEQKRRKADLLIMGAYRTRTAKRDLMASEKQLIVDEVACPVLLVR